MSAAIVGLGLVAPLPDSGGRVQKIGDEQDPKTRRLPRIDRMALALGSQDPSGIGLVYGTGYGGLGATVDFLEGIAARGPAFGSPTAFHQSVHHSAAGQISIALGIRGPCLTASSREISGEVALKVGLDLLRSGRSERVLVVAADEVVPALVAAYRAFGALGDEEQPIEKRRGIRPSEGAAALLLARDGGGPKLVQALVSSHPIAGLHFATGAGWLVPALRQARETCGGASIDVLPAAMGTEAEAAEAAAIASALPGARVTHETDYVGFNPSGGLLRTVLASMKANNGSARASIVHGLSLGGGQAAVVLRNEGS
jgi:3-oxoacyl-[acyl-carrier-protein] synthase II